MSHFTEAPSRSSVFPEWETSSRLIRVLKTEQWRKSFDRFQSLLQQTRGYLAIYFFLSLICAASLSGFAHSLFIFAPLFSTLSFSALHRAESKTKGISDSDLRNDPGFFQGNGNGTKVSFIYDPAKNRFTDASKETLNLFDYELSSFQKLGLLDVSPKTQPSGISSKELAREKIGSTIGGRIETFEWVHQERSGKELLCELRLAPFSAKGQILIAGRIHNLSAENGHAKPLSNGQISESQRTEELAGLALASASISSSLDLNKVLQVVARQFSNLLDVQICIISNWEKSTGELNSSLKFVNHVHSSKNGHFKPLSLVNRLQRSNGLDGYQVLQKRIDDPSLTNSELEALEEAKINTLLQLPLISQSKTIGVVELQDTRAARRFSEHDLYLAQTLSQQAAIAIENARLFQSTHRQLDELKILKEVAIATSDASDEDELITKATQLISEVLYPENFGVLMVDEENKDLYSHPSYEEGDGIKDKRISLGQGVTGRVALSGETLRISDTSKEENYLVHDRSTSSELCVAIKVGNRVIGVVNVESPQIDHYTEADEQLLVTFAGQLASGIERLRKQEAERTQREQAETLQKVALILGANPEVREVSDLILDQLVHVVPYDSASIQIVEGKKLIVRAVAGNLSAKMLGQDIHIREVSLSHPILQRQQTVLREDVSDDPNWLAVPGSGKIKSWIGAPLIVRGECVGVLTVDGYTANQFNESDAQLVSSFAIHAGIAIENSRLFEALEGSYTQTVTALANAIDVRDSYTIGHSQRLAKLAVETGKLLNCSGKELEDIHWAALLHDIGKIGIPDNILRKPSSLNSTEMDVIRKHPEIGARIVEPIRNLSHLAPIIRAHQEQYDGNGYPDGLSGEDIPLIARIISVADAYVAMTDERVYRKARSSREAISELKLYAGSQFDPEVVAAFLQGLKSNK